MQKPRVLDAGLFVSCEGGVGSDIKNKALTATISSECSVLCRPGSDRLSRGLGRSTMGAGGFNGRVRNGIGWDSPAMTTRSTKDGIQRAKMSDIRSEIPSDPRAPISVFMRRHSNLDQRTMRIIARTGLISRHGTAKAIKPIERLGPVSSTHCCAYTPGLSTWSSSTALERNLVLR